MNRCKRSALTAAVLAALLLSACTGPGVSSGSAPSAPAPSPAVSAPAASGEDAAPSDPGQAAVLTYDEIRTVASHSASPAVPCEGYFTMSRDGLWGLMRADGTELLACVFEQPVYCCGVEGHWIWTDSAAEPMSWEQQDALSATLRAGGDGMLCPGHGGSGDLFFYNLDSEGRDPSALDLTALRWYRMGTPGDVMPMDQTLWSVYGELLPVFSAHEEGEEGDPAYPGDPVTDPDGTVFWYIRQDGSGLRIAGAQRALWFFDQALAPVQLADGWAYTDRNGTLVTGADYSATWGQTFVPQVSSPRDAACLQNGYAAICRDGQWGLLDASGQEVIPCELDGVAWEGTRLWLKADGVWSAAEVPD